MGVSDATDVPVILGGTPAVRLNPPPWPRASSQTEKYLLRVLHSTTWGGAGPFSAEVERRLARAQGARYGLCVANGTIAMQLALEALDVGFGNEVIIPGLTWQGVAAAVLDVNAVPVLVDVDPDTYCIDPSLVEAAITPRTRAVLVVHLYNSLADLDQLLEIARQHGLFLVEDAAHAQGATWRGKGVGSWGNLGCFSFQQSKSLPGGEGGFITTDDVHLRELVWSLRHCGMRPPDTDLDGWRPIQSGDFRMSEWQAAVVLSHLEEAEVAVELRDRSVAALDASLQVLPGILPMKSRVEATRRNPFQYAFRYDPDQWDGLSAASFRAALTEELSVPVSAPFEPLNRSALYQPHTKKRYHLSDDYWGQIDPTRFHLPIAERAYRNEGMVMHHPLLLLDPGQLESVAQSVWRLRRNLPDLLRWQAAQYDRR